MPKYTCTKCGAMGHSKNIATRTFFPQNQLAAILTNIFNVTSEHKVPTSWEGKEMPDMAYWEVNFSVKVYERTLSQEGIPLESDEAEIRALEMLNIPENTAQGYGFTREQTVRHWLCNHNWHTDEEPEC